MYIYLMYLTDSKSTTPSYIKVGYTSQIGSVIGNYTKLTPYQISLGYYWTLPEGSDQHVAIEIKNQLQNKISSIDSQLIFEIIGQYRDMYTFDKFDEIFSVLSEEIGQCIVTPKIDKPSQSVDLTKQYKSPVPAVTDPNELDNKIKIWLSNKTIEQISKLLPAFKNNLRTKFTIEEIESKLMEVLTSIITK